jgi:very-short-patch-repair endonuclease
MQFGPLNREGGERRLNVLISRARLAMDVFANFTAADMDLDRSNARGVVALYSFLSYAESGRLQTPHPTGREPESPFEEAVAQALRQRGIEVKPQVGCAGFFIDVAVKDPERPGRYLLGIECDGATYHSARSARDRDRLRQEVLEGLGWRIHRVWSTDWYRDLEGEVQRILAAIEHAKALTSHLPQPRASTPEKDTARHIKTARTTETRQEMPLKAVAGYERASIQIPLNVSQLHQLPQEGIDH